MTSRGGRAHGVHPVARAALAAAGLALALAGCSAQSSGLVDQYNQGNASGNYISGDGSVVTIAPASRKPAVVFTGVAIDGSTISSTTLAGKVVVLNFWYADCPPCRLEAPTLNGLAQQFQGQNVAFVGVNVRDGADRATTFDDTYHVSYPSILDAADNNVQYAFADVIPVDATPVTLVLDTQGRVAARFSGLIQSPDLVSTVVSDLLAAPAA